MTRSDTYYRALSLYRSVVSARRDHARERDALISGGGDELIRVTRVHCTVDEEWIAEIERGLVFIDKAIREDRQFIYSNGEVVPIEKVKNVSKESVEHLARHAEYITREPEDDDLVPDKLYTVERISDYAVYENRFLYMLLCYLRDFVSLRYKKLLELTNCYRGSLSVKKEMVIFNRSLTLSLSLEDRINDEPWLIEHNSVKALIDRIDLILKTLTALLATPLMEEVGKVAMLKPPITKTNILKMDNNFKGAVALYEYIIEYRADGFTVEEDIRELSPFSGELADDLAQIELLLAFTVYRYGLGMSDELKASMDLDAANERAAELRRRTEQLEAVGRRFRSGELGYEEYIVELEEQVRLLQNQADTLDPLYRELDESRAAERELAYELDEQKRLGAELAAKLEAVDERHAEDKAALEAAHRAEKDTILASTRRELDKMFSDTYDSFDALRSEISEKDGEMSRLKEQLAKLTDERNCLEAIVLGRSRGGDGEKISLTDELGFERLEADLEAFIRFYKHEWRLAKRRIRRDLLNFKHIKELGEKDSSEKS